MPIPEKANRGVSFEHVWFGYPNTKPAVLKDISFAVKPGEVVALVGRTVRGKPRWPSCCAVCTTRRTDGSPWKTSRWTDSPQSPCAARSASFSRISAKYNLSVTDNIRFGNIDLPETDMEAVEKAAVAAGADRVIDTLPHGYQTHTRQDFQGRGGTEHRPMADDRPGTGFPEGRAPDRSRRAHQQPRPERRVPGLQPFQKPDGKQKRHPDQPPLFSFSTVRMADRILVLKEGRIVERGSHRELILKNGYYADLFRYQAKIDSEQVKCA